MITDTRPPTTPTMVATAETIPQSTDIPHIPDQSAPRDSEPHRPKSRHHEGCVGVGSGLRARHISLESFEGLQLASLMPGQSSRARRLRVNQTADGLSGAGTLHVRCKMSIWVGMNWDQAEPTSPGATETDFRTAKTGWPGGQVQGQGRAAGDAGEQQVLTRMQFHHGPRTLAKVQAGHGGGQDVQGGQPGGPVAGQHHILCRDADAQLRAGGGVCQSLTARTTR